MYFRPHLSSFPTGSFIRLLLILSVMLCVSVPASLSAAPAEDFSRLRGIGKRVEMPPYRPGEVIVIWNEGISHIAKTNAKLSVKVERVLSTVRNRQLLKLRPGVSAEEAVRNLNRNPSVKVAGLNRFMRLHYTPSSPSFPNQWGLHNTGQTIESQPGTPDADIDAVEAWDLETGNSNETVVAVIDSGIDLGHPSLSGRLWTNASDPVNGVDDDGNGYIDDNHGYNFAGISDYSVTDYWLFGYDSSSQYVAQSFMARGTNGQCRIAGLEMLFGKEGSPTQTITYAIRSSLTGGNIVQTNPITPDRIASSGFSFVFEPFTSVANLTPGNTYYFVAYTSSIDASNCYLIVDHLASNDSKWDSYVEGSEWWNLEGTWHEFSSDDFYFKSSGYYCNHDDCGHGTHCCGTVGAADSGSGSVGVAFGNATRLMALKAGDSSGGLWSSDWMEAIDYARIMGADIISMSFGGTGSISVEQAVIDDAYNAGLVLFASSGNGWDPTMHYPAGYDHVIGVGATDNQDTVADFSTYNASVDISAPGVDCYSTMPTYPVSMNFWGYTENYSYMSGTSMACPMAAGLGALVHSKAPLLIPEQIQGFIQANADDKGSPGRDNYYGYGRINACNTLVAVEFVKWSFVTESCVITSPAIGADGTIYMGIENNSNLFAINPDGTLKWAFAPGSYVSASPAIGLDGTIYVCSHDDKLYAVNPDGTQKWSFILGDLAFSCPAIGADGTIYVGSWDTYLYAVNPDGTQKWTFATGDDVWTPAIGADGTIYVGSSDNYLYAVNPDGTQKWAFATGDNVRSSPAIGLDGTIYVGSNDRNLYAVNPNGTQKWAFLTNGAVLSSPAIGADGTIYAGSYRMNEDCNLYAINPDGTQRWNFATGDGVSSSPAIGADGTVYVGSNDYNLYAVNPDGTQKWAFTTGGLVKSSPAIGPDGTVYVGSCDGNLYAIKSDSGGLAYSPWPMFHHNVKHTGSIDRSNSVRILGPPDYYYNDIKSAYEAAIDLDVIQVKAFDFPGDLVFNRNTAVTVVGGYDSLFEMITERSCIRGCLVIQAGCVTLKGMAIGAGP